MVVLWFHLFDFYVRFSLVSVHITMYVPVHLHVPGPERDFTYFVPALTLFTLVVHAEVPHTHSNSEPTFAPPNLTKKRLLTNQQQQQLLQEAELSFSQNTLLDFDGSRRCRCFLHLYKWFIVGTSMHYCSCWSNNNWIEIQ